MVWNEKSNGLHTLKGQYITSFDKNKQTQHVWLFKCATTYFLKADYTNSKQEWCGCRKGHEGRAGGQRWGSLTQG